MQQENVPDIDFEVPAYQGVAMKLEFHLHLCCPREKNEIHSTAPKVIGLQYSHRHPRGSAHGEQRTKGEHFILWYKANIGHHHRRVLQPPLTVGPWPKLSLQFHGKLVRACTIPWLPRRDVLLFLCGIFK